jgi:hypothetical protein
MLRHSGDMDGDHDLAVLDIDFIILHGPPIHEPKRGVKLGDTFG